MRAWQEVLGEQRLQLQPLHEWHLRHPVPYEGADQDADSCADKGADGCAYAGADADPYSGADEVPDYAAY